MTIPMRFTLPETQRAFDQWARITGLGWESAEWGEVWRALDDCGLLRADRLPERGLFDLPGTKLGDTRRVVHLRAAIVVGAMLHHEGVVADAATGAEVVAALLDRHYGDIVDWSFGKLSLRLKLDLPERRLQVHDSPGEALRSLVAPEESRSSLAAIALDTAVGHDEFAQAVFERLAWHPEWATGLVPLGSGRWLTFRT